MEKQVLEELRKSILTCDKKNALVCAEKVVAENISPQAAIDVLIEAIREVGDGYKSGELFLPEMVGAADVMQTVMPIIESAFIDEGGVAENTGTIVIGTVAGDIHTIGKSMVVSMMTGAGFKVHDLGTDVSADAFADAVQKYSPQVLAMSALLTTTAMEMKKVIDLLKEKELRNQVKVLVGGGAITEDFAMEIGADGYDPTAAGAAIIATELSGSKRGQA